MREEIKKTEKVVGKVWAETEGLQAFEEIEYGVDILAGKGKEKGKEKRKEVARGWGFRRVNGETVIPPVYSCVWKFENGVAKVCKEGKWGLIDKCGKVIVPIVYQILHLTSDGRCQVRIKGKWGCLKTDGTTVIEPVYDYIFPFRGAFAGIKTGKKYGFVHLDGREIVSPCFDEIGQISPDGTVKVRCGAVWKEIVLFD